MSWNWGHMICAGTRSAPPALADYLWSWIESQNCQIIQYHNIIQYNTYHAHVIYKCTHQCLVCCVVASISIDKYDSKRHCGTKWPNHESCPFNLKNAKDEQRCVGIHLWVQSKMQGHLGWFIDLWLHLLFETELKVKIKMMTSPSSYFVLRRSTEQQRICTGKLEMLKHGLQWPPRFLVQMVSDWR